MSQEPEPRVVFGPRDQHGLILGLRAGQIGILLCGVLLALGAITASQANPLAILAVLALAVLSGAAALMPVGGRGVDEWVPVVIRHLLGHPATWRSIQPSRGQRVSAGPTSEPRLIPAQPSFPPMLRHCSVLAVPVPRGELGVVRDTQLGTWTAVLRVRGSSFALLDSSEKARRMAAWGVAQAALAHHGCVQERVRVISAICGASLSRPLVPEERVAIELAVHAATPRVPWQAPTLPRVVDALLSPSERTAGEVHLSADELRTASRSVALELRRLVDGDLRGMFDSETSGDIDLQAPLVSFDLSAVYGTAALPILMACVGAWFQGVLTRDDQTKRIVVLDEAWAVLSNLETASWLRGSYKLARSYGVQYLAVLHRLADLSAAGDANSAQVRMARGLLADTETVVVYGQAPAEVDNTRSLLDLNDTEARLISTLPRGTALWRVGRRSHLVEHRVGPDERDLVDSDQRMREGRR
ncbi:MAG TPA: hypothetical protein DEG26_08445 [Chloroflexi bacterium]|jgi:hypothetical protein|nr:hypothetical protein [Chloroflexota bacterium]